MIVPTERQVIYRSLIYAGWPLLGLLAYDILVVIAYQMGYLKWKALEQIPLSLFGSAIGVILAFRNATSYARWWEARTLWGAIVNNARSVGREVTTVMRPAAEGEEAEVRGTQRRLVYLQIAWVHALRQHLRKLSPWEDIAHVLSEEDLNRLRGQQNVPVALQQEMSTILRNALDRGWIDITQWLALDKNIDDLLDAQGGSERIKNTPMPRQYDYFPQICVHMYCVLLPLTMVSSLGWFTPLGSTLVGFIFLALNRIGRDLEDPFENKIYDIPLTSMCATIEINLRQQLGETELPQPLQPVDGVLW
jgi:putative membrane protein